MQTAAVARMKEAEAPSDILVNNAGTSRPAPFAEVSEADYDAVMGLNLRAGFFVAQAVAPRQIGAGAGWIDYPRILADGACRRRPAQRLLCFQARAGRMTKAMAIDLAPHRICVNTICATFIEGPMTRPFFEDSVFRTDVLNRIK